MTRKLDQTFLTGIADTIRSLAVRGAARGVFRSGAWTASARPGAPPPPRAGSTGTITMLRNAGLTGLLLLAGGLAAGCGRTCYLQECDYNHYHTDLGLPNNLESNPHDALV